MAVAARFWVTEVTKKCGSGDEIIYDVTLKPVVSPSQGNDNWSKYTPSGTINLVVTNEAAGRWFEDRLRKNLAIVFDDVPA